MKHVESNVESLSISSIPREPRHLSQAPPRCTLHAQHGRDPRDLCMERREWRKMVLEQQVPVNQARASANSAGKGSLKASANIHKAFKPPQDVLIASQWTSQSCTSTSHRKSSRQPLMPGLIARKPIEHVYKHIPRPKATSRGAPAGTVWAIGRTVSNPIPVIEGPDIFAHTCLWPRSARDTWTGPVDC